MNRWGSPKRTLGCFKQTHSNIHRASSLSDQCSMLRTKGDKTLPPVVISLGRVHTLVIQTSYMTSTMVENQGKHVSIPSFRKENKVNVTNFAIEHNFNSELNSSTINKRGFGGSWEEVNSKSQHIYLGKLFLANVMSLSDIRRIEIRKHNTSEFY